MRPYFLVFLIALTPVFSNAQIVFATPDFSNLNTITTAVPIFSIPTDSRQLGMGLSGVVPAEQNRWGYAHSNPALIARGTQYAAANINYMPWLRSLVPDMNSYSAHFAAGFTRRQAVGLSYRYFSLGDVVWFDQFGTVASTTTPYEMSVQLNYGLQLTKHLKVGTAIKYLYSDLGGRVVVDNQELEAGRSLATDVGVAYDRSIPTTEQSNLLVSGGISATNVGSKMTYTQGRRRDFLPAELLLGGSVGIELEFTDIKVTERVFASWSKLLVPTPPIYEVDENGQFTFDENGDLIIAQGYDPNISQAQAIFQSFYDAPDGFREEISEVIHRIGNEVSIEYKEKVSLSLRQGIFLEADSKGGRKFVTIGAGISAFGFTLDGAYWRSLPNRVTTNQLSISLGYTYDLGKA